MWTLDNRVTCLGPGGLIDRNLFSQFMTHVCGILVLACPPTPPLDPPASPPVCWCAWQAISTAEENPVYCNKTVCFAFKGCFCLLSENTADSEHGFSYFKAVEYLGFLFRFSYGNGNAMHTLLTVGPSLPNVIYFCFSESPDAFAQISQSSSALWDRCRLAVEEDAVLALFLCIRLSSSPNITFVCYTEINMSPFFGWVFEAHNTPLFF